MRIGTLATQDGTTAAVFGDDTYAPVPGFKDAGAVLRAGSDGLARARDVVERATQTYDASDLRMPVLDPGAVICVGLNFRAHVLEMGREMPTAPTLFAKLPRSLCGPADTVRVAVGSDSLDYEGELVAVVGKVARNLDPEQAREAIAGYTLMNDVSSRGLQNRSLQWFAGKNLEASTPVGPWIVTSDEVDIRSTNIGVKVNGEVRQRAPLDDLIFDAPALVSDISRFLTLEPGDLIATGTPGGVGHGFKPPRYLADGDIVEVSVEHIGTLRTEFRLLARG
jgi:acylpyruvate hydrolase